MNNIKLTDAEKLKLIKLEHKLSLGKILFNDWQSFCSIYFGLVSTKIENFNLFNLAYSLYHADVINYTHEQSKKCNEIKSEIKRNLIHEMPASVKVI